MKVWLTAQEIAELELPGLPGTKRGVNALAERDRWQDYRALARERGGREGGGGIEYHIDLLPMPVRIAYLRRFVTVEGRDTRQPIDVDDGLSARARQVRDARLAILAVADRLRRDTGLSQLSADAAICGLYGSGAIELAPWVRQTVISISTRSLMRWRSERSRGGTARLGYDAAGSRKGTGVLELAQEGAVKTHILAVIVKQPVSLSAGAVRNTVVAKFGPELLLPSGEMVPVPPLRTFQHVLKSWRHAYRNEITRLTDPDGYRSKVEFVASGSTRADRLNEIWQIDASPLDAITLNGKRPTIYCCIDVFSRRIIILVTATPRAHAVGLLLRKAMLAWGVPERIKTDNGSDFKAHYIARLFANLGIGFEPTAPYDPRAKGIVERAIGTFQRGFAASLPGFVGHSVADRRVIEQRKAFASRLGLDDAHLYGADMTEGEVADYADAWASEIYAHTPHSGRGMDGRTPFEAAAGYRGAVRRIDSAPALDMLLAPVAGGDGRRRVTKSGITVEHETYWIGTILVGTDVFCRRDPADLGRLMVFAPDEETFLGVAVCPRLAGLDPAATIARVRAEQKAYLEGQLKPIRAAMRRIGPRDIADAQRAAARGPSGTLLAFPQAGVAHTTPALDAAGAVYQPAAAAPLSQEASALQAQLLAEEARPNVTPIRSQETRHQRFARALEVEARIKAGEPVPVDEARWLGSYQAGSEYRSMRDIWDESGGAMSL